MSVQLARDEVMSLFIAGHETTANMLGWFWCMMGRELEAAALVAAEVAQILHGRAPTAADLPQLVRVNQAIHETMRLYPPAWSISRRALGDDLIDGYFIPAGAVVALSPYAVHRHLDFWPDPERFDLERFTPEREEARHRYAYIPFGGGARKCIGNQFALMESGIIISLIMQRFRFVLAADHLIEEHALITLRAKNGVMATAVSLS
jgi:cytochrome P450